MWETHFSAIFARIDFFDNFALYLQYDIFLRRQYVSNTSVNAAEWQSKVWSQIIDGARIKGSNSSFPLALPSSSSGTSFAASQTTQPRSLPKSSTVNSRFPSSSQRSLAPTARPSSGSRGPSRFRCIFCGNTFCINRAICSLIATQFISLLNGSWQTAAGEQVCFRWNSRGCSDASCARKHLCSRCGSTHSAQECNL
jgi:hypothetical protein